MVTVPEQMLDQYECTVRCLACSEAPACEPVIPEECPDGEEPAGISYVPLTVGAPNEAAARDECDLLAAGMCGQDERFNEVCSVTAVELFQEQTIPAPEESVYADGRANITDAVRITLQSGSFGAMSIGPVSVGNVPITGTIWLFIDDCEDSSCSVSLADMNLSAGAFSFQGQSVARLTLNLADPATGTMAVPTGWLSFPEISLNGAVTVAGLRQVARFKVGTGSQIPVAYLDRNSRTFFAHTLLASGIEVINVLLHGTVENFPPVARIETVSSGSSTVLSSSPSTDPDGIEDIEHRFWYEDGRLIGTAETVEIEGAGQKEIALILLDQSGAHARSDLTVMNTPTYYKHWLWLVLIAVVLVIVALLRRNSKSRESKV